MRASILIAAAALSLPGSIRAQARPTPALEDTVALGAFLDGILTAQMQQFTIPSAAVLVVGGDRVLYARGYGWSDRERRVAVDPATSMFHIGSTGKLFTWTAVMQLVEQGKLDLDTDVNKYLGTFSIPATFPEPITLRHLMTHTAGFQEGVLGYFIGNDSVHIRSIEETLRNHVPARVRPPGLLASYSNYGAALAGFIVERVSGEPFAEYIERHIYQPLGIRYATFREPVPASLRPSVVIGYEPENGVFVRQPPEINGGFTPAGGTVMSTLDMGRFMTAHLHAGRLGEGRILDPATAELMHRTAFTHDSAMPGMALGFIEGRVNGRRTIGHDGDSKDFHCGMVLLPEADVGIYVAYGASGGDVGREQVFRSFFDRYFPVSAGPVVSTSASTGGLERYAGAYRMVRMNYADIDKVIWAFLPPIRIAPLTGDTLELTGGVGPDARPGRFVPVGPHLFAEVDGDRRIGFGVDSSGSATHLYTNPTVDNERVPWSESMGLWYPLLLGAGLVLLHALLGLGYQRRELRAMAPAERRTFRLAGWTAGWLVLTLLVLGGVVLVYQTALTERIPVALKVALLMPLGFVAMTSWLVVGTIRAWRRGFWTRGRRVLHSLAAVAALTIVWFFARFNILGWQFG